jgi:hypothetical protein
MPNPQPITEAELQALLDQVPKTGGSYHVDPVARTVTRIDEPTVMPDGAITARDPEGDIHHEISAKQEIAAKVEAEATADPVSADPGPAAPLPAGTVAAVETAATVFGRASRTKSETPSTDASLGDTPTA